MTSEPASRSGSPDHPEQLRTEIEQTRQQLGETVDQLTAKTDVKARAQAKVADLTQRAKDTAGQVRQQAEAAGETGREQLQARTPDAVKRTAAAGAVGVRQNRTPLAIAAGVLVLGVVAVRWWRRR